MQKSIHHTHSCKALTPLSAMLKEWIKVNEHYVNVHGDDACWWYNERATLSSLAGAAWRVGWLALEEYGTTKGDGSRDAATGKPKSKYGRCDMYVTAGDFRSSSSYSVEAKQIWRPIGPYVANPIEMLEESLKDAWKDAGKLSKEEADKRLAITFIVPSFPASLLSAHACAMQDLNEQEIATDLVQRWLDEVVQRIKCDALAYCFPKKARVLRSNRNERIFPGIVSVIRQKRRANKSKKLPRRGCGAP